jgi:hypothetical protein
MLAASDSRRDKEELPKETPAYRSQHIAKSKDYTRLQELDSSRREAIYIQV